MASRLPDSDLTETKRGVQAWLSNAPWRQQEDGTDARVRPSRTTAADTAPPQSPEPNNHRGRQH